jgi:hypothetical protein
MRSGLIAAALIAACAGPAPRAPAPATPPESPEPTGVLAHVPADTPYFYALLEKPPPGEIERTLGSQLRYLERALPLLERLAAEDGSGALPLIAALAAELEGRADLDGLRQLGVAVGEPMVVFGLGAFPALRMQLGDETAFTGLLERIALRAGLATAAGSRAGRPYWSAELGPLTAVVAVDGDQLSAALVPTAAAPRLMPQILGLVRPVRSLGHPGLVAELARRHRFAPYKLAAIDVRRTLAAVLGPGPIGMGGEPAPAAIDVLAPEAELGDRCRRQLVGLGDAVPRLVFGSRHSERYRERGAVAIELPRRLARRFVDVSVPMPGLGSELARRADLVAGLGLRPSGLVRLAADAASRLAELDACPFASDAGALETHLEQLMPAARAAGGIGVAITEYREDETGEPARISGAAAVSIDDPPLAFALLSAWLPGHGLPGPASGAGPSRLPPSDPAIDPVWWWFGPRMAGLSMGLETAGELERFAVASSADDELLAVMRLRGALARELDPDPDPELAALDPELADSLAELSRQDIESLDVALRAAPAGLEIAFDIRYRPGD